MTKNELIGQALLSVSGGVYNSDSAVRWAEAETYLVAAVNYIQTGNYWVESRAEGERTINPLLLVSFDNIPVQYSEDRRQMYADLPKRVLVLPKARALQVFTKCGKVCIPLGHGDESTEEYYGKFKKVISYQPEGQRLWFWNMTRLVEAVRSKQIVHVSDVGEDEEILLPSDGEVKVLELMVGWLSGEKKWPADYVIDGKDK